jgi:coniferyl-aldehyde dehydrogenase
MSAVADEHDTAIAPMRQVFDRMRSAFAEDMLPTHATRDDRLRRLAQMTKRHAQDIIDAIAADFGARSAHETLIADLLSVDEAIKHARGHLRGWMRTRRMPTGIKYRPGYNRLIPQPLGVVGVVAPWNYPYQLAMLPALAALAAGNRVMIKPSELTPRTAALMAGMVRENFGEDELAVFPGDAATGKAFVELPFDHLFFTGSTAVGRIVAQAAAKNLTPVTLEVPRTRVDEFATALSRAIAVLYPTLAGNRDYSSIVNPRHYARLQELLTDARSRGARVIEVNPAGEMLAPAMRKIAPTLVLDVADDMAVMREEIFGPLLPVVTYDGLDDAIGYVNGRDRPLALYWFGDNAVRRERVLRGTIAGGVTVNGCLTHFAQEAQPFGGVGASGSGTYHGEYGFRTFSKEKPVYYQSRRGLLPLLLPPYGKVLGAVMAAFVRGGGR